MSVQEDQLLEMVSDGSHKTMFATTTLPLLWIRVMAEYPEIATTALITLLPFPTSFLCEDGFSAVTATKTKQAKLDRKIHGKTNVWSTTQRQKKIYGIDVHVGF